MEKGTPLSYINTGGDPEIVTDYRTPMQKFSDELPVIAHAYIPLLVLIALYVIALVIRPLAVRLLRRFGKSRQ